MWTAKVKSINDGDTIGVDIDGDGSRRVFQIRFTGIQAMEETRYSEDVRKLRGQCHAVAAAVFVHRLVRLGHHRVRLTSQNPRTDSQGRLFRYLAVRIGGRWQDVGQAEMTRGLTLWMNQPDDPLWNETYDRLGQEAAQRHIGMFDTTTCGAGPSQDIPLKTWVMSDPPGIDSPAGEWVKLRNLDTARSIDLGRWWIRDSGLRRFTFPAGTRLGPGADADAARRVRGRLGQRLLLGPGRDDLRELDDAATTATAPTCSTRRATCARGRSTRAWSPARIPTRLRCASWRMRAGPSTRWSPTRRASRSTSTATSCSSAAATTPSPRAPSCRRAGRSPCTSGGSPASDSGLAQYAGIRGAYLPDSGGAVELRTFEETVLSCSAWGSGRC